MEYRRVAFCPHCCNTAPQRLVCVQKYQGDVYNELGEVEEGVLDSTYFVAVCETCAEVILYHQQEEGIDERDFNRADRIWPTQWILHKAVPKAVADIYSEAAAIRKRAPNAFAVQARRALEAICRDRGATGRNLSDMLTDLARKGEIPNTLAEMTSILREIGNIGAHADHQSVKPDQVYAIDEFLRAIVEYVYVAPHRVSQFRKALDKAETQQLEDIDG